LDEKAAVWDGWVWSHQQSAVSIQPACIKLKECGLPCWMVNKIPLNKIKSLRRHFTFFVFYLAASQPIDFRSHVIDSQKASLKKSGTDLTACAFNQWLVANCQLLNLIGHRPVY
jgi:hypothetical protein